MIDLRWWCSSVDSFGTNPLMTFLKISFRLEIYFTQRINKHECRKKYFFFWNKIDDVKWIPICLDCCRIIEFWFFIWKTVLKLIMRTKLHPNGHKRSNKQNGHECFWCFCCLFANDKKKEFVRPLLLILPWIDSNRIWNVHCVSSVITQLPPNCSIENSTV